MHAIVLINVRLINNNVCICVCVCIHTYISEKIWTKVISIVTCGGRDNEQRLGFLLKYSFI